MYSKRELIIFFAGAEAFHTLSHMLLPMIFILPTQLGPIVYTQQWNLGAIIVNALITIGLLWWAHVLKK